MIRQMDLNHRFFITNKEFCQLNYDGMICELGETWTLSILNVDQELYPIELRVRVYPTGIDPATFLASIRRSAIWATGTYYQKRQTRLELVTFWLATRDSTNWATTAKPIMR